MSLKAALWQFQLAQAAFTQQITTGPADLPLTPLEQDLSNGYLFFFLLLLTIPPPTPCIRY